MTVVRMWGHWWLDLFIFNSLWWRYTFHTFYFNCRHFFGKKKKKIPTSKNLAIAEISDTQSKRSNLFSKIIPNAYWWNSNLWQKTFAIISTTHFKKLNHLKKYQIPISKILIFDRNLRPPLPKKSNIFLDLRGHCFCVFSFPFFFSLHFLQLLISRKAEIKGRSKQKNLLKLEEKEQEIYYKRIRKDRLPEKQVLLLSLFQVYVRREKEGSPLILK